MSYSTIQENITLKNLNTFGVDAKASYFVKAQNKQDLIQLLSLKEFQHLPKFVLGEGSNILFTQDYPGLVIKVAMKGIQLEQEDDNYVWIQVGAGENWHDFVIYCVKHGYAGIENLSLIPGTVGAAPIQNIGAYGAELKDVFIELTALNLQEGSIRIFKKEDCQFGYRDSIFKHAYKNQFIILSVVLRLSKKPNFNISYGNLKETLELMQIKDLNIKAISDAVIRIRCSKLPDPKKIGNAGSFFKNPIISYADFLKVKKSYPDIPHFNNSKDTIKLNAAWLIEQCGWKGKRFGNIGVYEKQALILVNYANGTAAEIQELANKIQQSVAKKFGVSLSPEVIYV